MIAALRSGLERLYAPIWAGGYAGTRLSFALAAGLTMAPRVTMLGDAYAAPDMSFRVAPFYLADHLQLTLPTATGLWAASLLGLLGLAWGGRLARPGLLLWASCAALLLAAEGFNIKAYDRLLFWIALGLLFSPIHERGLLTARRSPWGRWFVLLVYIGLYGSTGGLKALQTGPGSWWTGTVLPYHLVDVWFGNLPVGVAISAQPWLWMPMQWFTLLFELGFPLAVLLRRLNPLWLLLGLVFHLGVLALMNVGPFSFVALCAYPLLLHPEAGRRLWERQRGTD